MKNKTTTTTAPTFESLTAELDMLERQAADDAAGDMSVDELAGSMLERHMRIEAIRTLLPRYRKMHLYDRLLAVRADAVSAGNRLAHAAHQLYAADAELAQMRQKHEDTRASWAAEHVAAQNEASNYWNEEAALLAELRVLGEDV